MRTGEAYLAILAQLHEIADPAERVGAWRQGMAALAAAAQQREPAPLEGLAPAALLMSIRAAARDGLIGDVAFLSPAAGGLAHFELASALPAGEEKRDLGRRVLERLRQSDGPTFVALATALAGSSSKALGETAHARVALALATPLGAGTGPDGLALALVSRRDLEREWLVGPSVGSLAARRMAARLLERSAREAVRRLSEGDESAVMVFLRASLRDTTRRLLADRESLVWRHVAAARGLLAEVVPQLSDDIEQGLATDRGPTEWRRSAASLAATLAVAPELAADRLRELVRSELVQRDPGIAGALVAGLASPFVVEPESADLIAAEAVELGGLAAVEALVELRRELGGIDAGWAIKAARARIEMELAHAPDREDAALLLALQAELGDGATPWPVAAALREGQLLAVEGQFAAAREVVLGALAAADEAIDWLERSSDDVAAERRHGYRILRELDHCLLEQDVARHLLAADGLSLPRPVELEALQARLEGWLLARESGPGPGLGLRMQRLRVLVHLVDRESSDSAADQQRQLGAFRRLLQRARGGAPELRRVVAAALARACDALVRDEVVEFSDVLLGLAGEIGDVETLAILREASMLPDLARVLGEYAAALEAAQTAVAFPSRAARVAALATLAALARALPPAVATRLEAVRVALLRVSASLRRVDAAPSIEATPTDALDQLGRGVAGIEHLLVGARRRLGLDPVGSGAALALGELAGAILRATAPGELAGEVAATVAVVRDRLPAPIALAIEAVLVAAIEARDGDETIEPGDDEPERDSVLPSWLPPSRTIGGFYVVRALAAGAGGSVLLACRADERQLDAPELFALKVPDYDGGAARSLSEDEFSRMFREEARALLSLPEHPNLSGFVTFDVGARPKPILVMELVRGPSLEEVLDRRALDTRGAFALLDGIAAGLGAMHASQVAHLDVKPANVILRDGGPLPTPVLVDFGLAGRRLRPGCGSPHYGAPEVWSAALAADAPAPPADVYAFACLSYEVLVGELLATGENPLAVVSAHMAGQAGREALAALARDPVLKPVARWLRDGLAREHRQRPSMVDLRARLARLGNELGDRPWPLAPSV